MIIAKGSDQDVAAYCFNRDTKQENHGNHAFVNLPLFNFYAMYIMRKAGLEETQTEIKIAGRNINNLRYA